MVVRSKLECVSIVIIIIMKKNVFVRFRYFQYFNSTVENCETDKVGR